MVSTLPTVLLPYVGPIMTLILPFLQHSSLILQSETLQTLGKVVGNCGK